MRANDRIARMPARGLYAVLNAGEHSASHLQKLAYAAIQGGAVLLQYRDKTADAAGAITKATSLLAVTRPARVPLLINDDVALALRINADGVHLGRTDTGIDKAREVLGPQAIIGATCHNALAAACRARAQGANYVSFGRFFASQTKPDAPAADMQTLTQAQATLDCPVVAIGGINADNGATLLRAGADLLAVSGGLFAAPDCAAAAAAINDLFT